MSLTILKIILLLIKLTFILSDKINIQKSELKNKPPNLIELETKLGTLIGYKQDVNIPNLVNKKINVFYGIPYAEPINKSNRFKKTKLITKFPVNPWAALSFRPHCIQSHVSKYHKDDQFSENCHYMNIWTPNLESIKQSDGTCKKKFNVMVYLYADQIKNKSGKSSIYQMAPLIDQNNNSYLSYSGELFSSLYETILITFNFRQQLFANLYLEDEYPANLALFDQNLAFKFIKQELIDSLCGLKNFTVFGNSFGGNAISMHLISRYSKNLIKNVILQSTLPLFTHKRPITKNEIILNSFLAIHRLGCTCLNSLENINFDELNEKIKFKYFNYGSLDEKIFIDDLEKNWIKTDPHPQANSKLHDKFDFKFDLLNKDTYLDQDLVKLVKLLSKNVVNLECMKNVSTDQILNLPAMHNLVDWEIYYDNDFIDRKTYLDYKLFNKLNINEDLNLLIGNLKDENCLDAIPLVKQFYFDKFSAPFISKGEVEELIKNVPLSFDGQSKLNTKIIDYYTNLSKWSLERGYYDSLMNLRHEYFYVCSNYFFSNYLAKSGAKNVYSYLIDYNPTFHFESNLYQLIDEMNLTDHKWLGICHGDETNYIFALPFKIPNQFNDLDRKFSLKLMNLWTSFARNGKMPNLDNGSEWPSADESSPKPKYVEINGHFLRERKFEFEERCDNFWRKILPLYKK